jgi:hypothetical protein
MSSEVKNKILNHAVQPPPGIWNKIAAELDDSLLHQQFPNKLYEAEVNAPAGVWNKIAASLNDEQSPIEIKRRVIPWMRYAAAAVVIGLVAWGGIQLLNRNKKADGIETVKKQQPAPTDDQTKVAIAPVVTNKVEANIQQSQDVQNDRALEESKKTFAKLDVSPTSHKFHDIAAAFSFASNNDGIDESENDVAGRDADDINDRYIVLMRPDGHCVRMAKKLSSMVCCVSGEDMDKDCIDQMSRWKEKMACSPTGHATGSFLDILSLLKSLDEQ